MTAESLPSPEAQAEAKKILGQAFTKNDERALDPEQVFRGLFRDGADPDRLRHDRECLVGRVQELCLDEPTSEQLQSIVEVSKVPGLEPVRRIAYDLLAHGTLIQKKKAAKALAQIDPSAAAIMEALDQLVDKPSPEPPKVEKASPRFVCGTELVSGRE